MSSSFPGLTDADFEAYAPSKWKSNVHNRPRLEVKQKLLSLGRDLAPRLVGADGSPLATEASVEHPARWNHQQVEAQHLYFSRNEEARKELDRIIERGQSLASRIDDPTPQRNHLFLALTVAHERVELGLRLHPDARVDRQNLERKCEDHFEREKLVGQLRRLPAGFTIGLAQGPIADAHEVDETRVRELLESFAAPPPAPASPLGAFAASLPGAAPPPSRLLTIGLAVPRAEVVAAGPAFGERAAEALTALLPLYHFIAWSRDNDYVSMRDVLQRERQVKRQRGIVRHDEVRVVRGMFAGKTGVVQEIDARGGVKLLVGKLLVKVDAEDVDKR
jgi:transcription antitermination factor NusG